MTAASDLGTDRGHIAPADGWCRLKVGGDIELLLRHQRLAAVLDPGEFELTGTRHLHEEGQVGIGRNTRTHVRDEHLDAREPGGERVEDMARIGLTRRILLLARLYDVGDQRLDLDHLADLGGLGEHDTRLGHDVALLESLALLWQIHSRSGSAPIHLRQCGHR